MKNIAPSERPSTPSVTVPWGAFVHALNNRNSSRVSRPHADAPICLARAAGAATIYREINHLGEVGQDNTAKK